MNRCRYVLANLVPDLVRNEPINVGIVLQSDSRVAARFIPRLPQALLPDDYMRAYVEGLQDTWDQRLSKESELIQLPGWERPRMMALTDEDYLHWLHESWATFLQFSEPRSVEAETFDAFQVDMLMNELYSALVSRRRPRGAARVSPTIHVRTREQVKRGVQKAFERFGIEDQFTSPAEVDGRIVRRWSFDWAHLNRASGLLIDTVWLGHREPASNIKDAAYVSTKARDVKDVGQYEIHAIIYSPNGAETDTVREARGLLDREGVRVQRELRVDELAAYLVGKLPSRPLL